MANQEATSQPAAGRFGDRFHPAANYILPSDEIERERLLEQHEILRRLPGEPGALLPRGVEFREGDKLLDAGAGSGAWAIEIASLFPDAEVTACDIDSRLFPSSAPKNAAFIVQSVVSLPAEWSSTFALVHQDRLMYALGLTEWKRALSEYFRVLKPGGWIHLNEIDVHGATSSNIRTPPVTTRFRQALTQLCKACYLWPLCVTELPELLKDCGFEDVGVRTTYIALGPGDAGQEIRKPAMASFRSMETPIMTGGGFGVAKTEEEYQQLMNDMEAEWVANDFGANRVEFTARKPL